MDFEIDPDQQALLDSARKLLLSECPVSLVRAVVEEGVPVDALWQQLVQMGVPALAVPKEYGGLGQGFVDVALLFEEFGRAILPGPALATVGQFLPVLLEVGQADGLERFGPGVASGEVTGTLAMADDVPSWHPKDVSTRALPTKRGWRLSGTKRWVIDGHTADELAVVARCAGPATGLGVFLVPQNDVRSEVVSSLDLSRSYATVVVDDVFVPTERVLGVPGQVDEPLARTLDWATVTLAAEIIGTCQAIFEMTLQYAKDRVQFDKPIGAFQAIQHKLANMLIVLEKARSVCYFAAMTIAEDDARRHLAASAAKAAAGDCQLLVAKEGIQIHGGIGYTWRHDLHLYVKRAKSGEALLGTTSDHRVHIADLLEV